MVKDEKDIRSFQNIIKKHPIIIADGHHRYITCLRHSRAGGCKYIMTLFIDFNEPGLIIYTSHRQIHKLDFKTVNELKYKVKEYFDIDEDFNNFHELKEEMEKCKGNHVFGCYYQNKFLLLTLKKKINPIEIIPGNHSNEWKNLSLPILHTILLEKCLNVKNEDISYIKDIDKGLSNADEGENAMLLMVNSTTLEEIHNITKAGEIMPQKSTYFFPKPLSGLIIHRHDVEIE